MKPLGISRNQLARDVDVPVGRISDITNGKRGITADTALRLAHYFGTDAALWVRLQAEYDLHLTRMTKWPAIRPRVRMLQLADAAKPGPADAPPAVADEIRGDSHAPESQPERPAEPPGVRWSPAPTPPEEREAVVETAEKAVTAPFSKDEPGWSR